MKEICLDITGCRALGDALCATPLIRKLYNSYNKKVSVITHMIELFQNNPYVESVYHDLINREELKEKYDIYNTFDVSYKENGVCNKHNSMDIRQFHAISLGLMLTKEEMTLDYIPKYSTVVPNIPEKYVLIHSVQNWNSRTWDINNWKFLTKLLNEKGISVISIGKDSSELGGSNVDKPVFDFEIQNGLNLVNKTTLDETWSLIANSLCFITMDSGLLHLAGTTDAQIIQLGSSINPEFRAPYRYGSQDYKYHYIRGGCGLHCASDVKYGVREWGSIQGVPPLVNCLENKPTFECHPSVIQVYNKVLEFV
jgi:ADP-heptose:LPS heptosyltransferase